jgi:hypothetical protein
MPSVRRNEATRVGSPIVSARRIGPVPSRPGATWASEALECDRQVNAVDRPLSRAGLPPRRACAQPLRQGRREPPVQRRGELRLLGLEPLDRSTADAQDHAQASAVTSAVRGMPLYSVIPSTTTPRAERPQPEPRCPRPSTLRTSGRAPNFDRASPQPVTGINGSRRGGAGAAPRDSVISARANDQRVVVEPLGDPTVGDLPDPRPVRRPSRPPDPLILDQRHTTRETDRE